MRKFLTWLSRRRYKYDPLVVVELSKNNLIHNLEEFRKLAPLGQIAPVLKSNAYGHGIYEIADILEAEGTGKVPFFVVDSYFEAIALRSHGTKTPLLVVGYTRPETITDSILKNVAFTVTNMETLESLTKAKSTVRLHLKVDTGMHRHGILPEEVDRAIQIIKKNQSLALEGVISHLGDADNHDTAFTQSQISLWNSIIKKFYGTFPTTLKYVHLSATDGHRFSTMIEANVSRLGIGLYGLTDGSTFEPRLDLKPVLEMKTIITGVKKLHKGETIGYGNTFRAESDNSAVATIPVGYYEGLDRRLSNKGHVLVGPERTPAKIIGRVSMNITSIDASQANNVAINTPVVVISNVQSDPNSIMSIVKLSEGTIPYEMVVKIPAHLKRVVV